MLAAVRSATVFGVEGRAITVEVHVSTGLPSFQIVGLPDEACRESRDRVRAAVLSSGLAWPSCRVTVNLAPSGQRKGGSGLDLPIAIGFLAANGQVPVESLEGLGFVGELGLDGSLRGVPGIAPMVAAMQPCRPVVPMAGFREAQGVVGEGARVGGSLRAVVDALNADEPWPMPPDDELFDDDPPVPDLADVRGQAMARLGLEVAAAGGHHMLLVGAPGSGKTMLAKRLPGLLPPLARDDALATTMVHSAAGVRLPAGGLVRRPPFRAPHHSSSMVSLVGGGSTSLRPGEISLAHGDVPLCSSTMSEPVVLYCRISDDPEGNLLGVSRQEQEGRELADRLGLTVVDVFIDDDRSAFRRQARPAFDRLTDTIRSGAVSTVIVWHPDRLTRHPRELEDLIDLLETHQVSVHTVVAGQYDLSTPAGRMVARAVGAVARYESEHKSARLRSMHRQLAEAGGVAGGGRAFGYMSDKVTPDPVEAPVVADVYRMLLDGWSIGALCRFLDSGPVAPVGGGKWRPAMVRRILTRPRYAGLREHHGRIVGRAVWPGLVDESTWSAAQAILSDPNRRKNWHRSLYLLTGGVAHCGLCNRPLIARPNSKGERCYVCPPPTTPGQAGCGKIRRLAGPVETEVVARLRALLSTIAGPVAVDDSTRTVAADLAAIDDRLAGLAHDHYVAQLITRTEFMSARAPLAQQAELLRARLARQPRHRRRPVISIDQWDTLDHDHQRAIISDWIDQVIIHPATRGRNTFDPTKIEVRWRS